MLPLSKEADDLNKKQRNILFSWLRNIISVR